eukprot:ANDGO_06148.mRNA.1 hypothetical protein SAMD00019534_017630
MQPIQMWVVLLLGSVWLYLCVPTYGQGHISDNGIPATCSRMPLLCPAHGLFGQQAPAEFVVRVETDVGTFDINAVRSWSPHGVDRFWALASLGFYDDAYFYRVLHDWVAQFGTSGSPALTEVWRWENEDRYHTILPDEPLVPGTSNLRGVVSYSCEYEPTTQMAVNRTSELYINYRNNSRLDAHGFTPIGFVSLSDMTRVVDLFFSYGEVQEVCVDNPQKNCTGPSLSLLQYYGNDYLVQQFPKLNRILRSYVLNGLNDPSQQSSCDKSDSEALSPVASVIIAVVFVSVFIAAVMGIAWWIRRRISWRNRHRGTRLEDQ